MCAGVQRESLDLSVLTALPHRLEPVHTAADVTWVNDSKATNVDAAMVGIAGIQAPLIVLLGGAGKDGSDYTRLNVALAHNTRQVICFGAAGDAIARQLEGVDVHTVTTLADAITEAAATARAHDVVLLSLACASFDESRTLKNGRSLRRTGPGGHLMKNRSIDPWLILTSTLLIVFGLIMVYSASAMKAFERTGDETYYLTRQLIALAVGMVLCVSTAVTPMRIIRRYRIAIYVAVLAGLVLALFRASATARTARTVGSDSTSPPAAIRVRQDHRADHAGRLPRCGPPPDRRRPGGAKGRARTPTCAAAHPAAARLRHHRHHCRTVRNHGLHGGLQLKHTAVAGMSIIVGIPVMVFEPYRVKRLTSFLDPWQSMESEGSTSSSRVAMHSGGFGQGLGNSQAKLDFLPEPWTDFIGAVIAEELGLFAIFGLIALYALFLWRGLRIARQARDAFSMLLAGTLTLMVGFEAFFNLGVVMGILPPKGLVLPFISYGATAMMSHLWVIGILLSISAESHSAPFSAGWPLAEDDPKRMAGAA